MAHAENEITIHRPPLDVYAFLADGLNNPDWRSGVRSIALKSGKPGTVGAVYSQTITGPGGRSIAGDYTITTADPGSDEIRLTHDHPHNAAGSRPTRQPHPRTLITNAAQALGCVHSAGSVTFETVGTYAVYSVYGPDDAPGIPAGSTNHEDG